jgi:ATP-dependent RNA helicase RhlE
MSFDKLGLSAPLLQAIEKKGYTTPSPIQEKAIPLVLQRKDVLASAQTGTGKTAGFTLPLLEILGESKTKGRRKVRALVLTPTRELAAQVYENFKEYSTFIDFKTCVIFGGVKQNPQVNQLRQGVDAIVATPGRLLDLHSQKEISLNDVEILVLDEADRMLDMGFLRDINRIIALMPKKRQNLLFSATFSKEIKKLAGEFLNDPVLVEATPGNTTAEKVTQRVIRVDKGLKTAMTIKMISEGEWSQVLMFTRTKHGANKLTEKLVKAGISAAAIHGNKSQNHRTKTLAGFKAGSIRVLVATDIAARGLDIPLLPHVINYEIPNVPEDYVHRIGRTGRAGAKGEAISLVCNEEVSYLRGIEKLLKMQMNIEIEPGFEPTEEFKESPKKKNQGHNPRGGRSNGGGGQRKGSGGGNSNGRRTNPNGGSGGSGRSGGGGGGNRGRS